MNQTRFLLLPLCISLAVLQTVSHADDAPSGAATKTAAVIPDDPNDSAALRKIKYVFCVPKSGNIETVSWAEAAGSGGEALVHLKGLHSLKWLDLSAKFNDDDLVRIEDLKTLEWLNLTGTNVTDVGLVHLRGLARLTILHLDNCQDVTDAGLIHLSGLTEMQRLYLGHTNVRGDGLKHLQSLKRLRLIDLAYTKMDNESLAYVAGLAALDDLDLSGTKITDSGLPQLRPLSRLKLLTTWDTKVTRVGGERLIADLPKLAIIYSGSQRPKTSSAVPKTEP